MEKVKEADLGTPAEKSVTKDKYWFQYVSTFSGKFEDMKNHYVFVLLNVAFNVDKFLVSKTLLF